MKMISKFVSLAVVLCCIAFSSIADAGKYNTQVDIGDQAPEWQSLPGVDGSSHSSESIAKAKVVVLVFTCNSCPYAVDVEERLNSLTKDYREKGVAVVAINSNKVDEDKLPAMKERADEKELTYSYLWDESQQVAKSYGAKFTPEFFVLDKKRVVRYMGAFDDSPTGENIEKKYVIDAVEAVLDGRQVEIAETPPIGCLIRYERERRRRRK